MVGSRRENSAGERLPPADDDVPAPTRAIRQARLQQGLSLRALSARAGMPYSTLSKLENGKKTIWSSDSNLNAFFHHDAVTGNIFERVQLPDDSPVIHGAKLVGDYMYACDDMGWMWRFKI